MSRFLKAIAARGSRYGATALAEDIDLFASGLAKCRQLAAQRHFCAR